MNASPQYEEAVTIALGLTALEKVQLVGRIVAALEDDLSEAQTTAKSLNGGLADLGTGPSSDEIDEARPDVWGAFPQEDIFG